VLGIKPRAHTCQANSTAKPRPQGKIYLFIDSLAMQPRLA
jgi:hypothetical protein